MSRLTLAYLALSLSLMALPASAGGKARDQAVDWLAAYLRIDTSNPPGRESRAAAFLAHLLARAGIPARLIVNPAGRVSVYARLEAERPEAPTLLLTHHLDVVPPGPGWTVDPFGGLVREGRVWGRGAIDTKGLGIAHLAALLDLEKKGCRRRRHIAFLAVPDEELGGGQGMAWLHEHEPSLFQGVEAVFNEGGAGRMSGDGRLIWWEVEVSQKRPLWLEAKTTGRGGHASSLSPDSPNHRLIAALARLIEQKQPYRISQPARDFLAAVARLETNPRQRRTLENLDRVIQPEGPTELIHPGFHRLFLDTVQVTVVQASDSINVIAPEASAKIDVRMLPDTDAALFEQRIRAVLGDDVELTVLLSAPPAASSSTRGRAFAAAKEVLEQEAPVLPSLSSGFTDSRFFRQKGIDAYGLSPFTLEVQDVVGVHAANERMPVAEFERGIDRLLRILEHYACNEQ